MRAQRPLLRALDANTNRAREGLRVCEDLVRFVIGSERDFRQLRSLRHGLNRAMRRLPVTARQLVAARDSVRDPGRRARGAPVQSVEHLLLLNLQRTKEALRVVEECSRVLCPPAASVFQTLRFRTYDVERDLVLHLASVRDPRPGRRRRP